MIRVLIAGKIGTGGIRLIVTGKGIRAPAISLLMLMVNLRRRLVSMKVCKSILMMGI